MVTLLKSKREYIDLDFSFDSHPITKNVSIKKNINSIKQSIIRLLMLKEGDKPFHPEIKSPIFGYLFENASSILRVVMEGEVRKYLEIFEPRVYIEQVKIFFPDPNAIDCRVTGTIINVSEPFTVSVLVDRLR